jgi:hypothetical protein
MKLLKCILIAPAAGTENGFPLPINDVDPQSRHVSSTDIEFNRDLEIIGLKALISSKNERIATLRTVLKANKQTAEAGIKYKFTVECPYKDEHFRTFSNTSSLPWCS